ncbi:MAG: polysaccharide deacetylase family protein [Planctomycetota bacterium]
MDHEHPNHLLTRHAQRLFAEIAWALMSFAIVVNSATGQTLEDGTSSQVLVIRYRDVASADRAHISIEPLYNGHHRAVSCRWDDNWTSDNQGARDLMEEYGIRGTWYLNDRNFSPENRPADYLPVAKELLRGGNSIGGHSLTHPYITYFHANRTFAEMSGVRVTWESALDKPMLSYAYSFVDISPGPEHRAVLRRTLDSLTRSGFDHLAEFLHFFDDVKMHQVLSPIMPPENRPYDAFRTAVDWAYNDAKLTQKHPMITNSMHAWYGTPRLNDGYDELRKRFELLSSLEDVWHCNQNQYAGYRRQFRHASIIESKKQGATVTYRLNRPTVRTLNDNTPLTLAISGVSRDQINSIKCNDGQVSMSERSVADRIRFNVSHRTRDRLPKKIAHIANPSNTTTPEALTRDPDFPQLIGCVFAEDGQLKLSLQSEDESLEDVTVVWRVPIGYQSDSATQHVRTKGKRKLNVHYRLVPSMDPDTRWGREHFAAQVDFRLGNEPGRLHLTCQRPGPEPGKSLPREGFRVLGPIDAASVPATELLQLARDQWDHQRWGKTQWSLPGGNEMTWRTKARDGYVKQEWLNPEYVRTMGTWEINSPTYLLRSTIRSPTKRRARLMISHPSLSIVLVNGHRVDSNEFNLLEGENRILIIYPGCSLGVGTQRVAACFLRLSNPATGRRMRDIQYEVF